MGAFDGSGDYLTVPDHDDWRLGGSGSGAGVFTIETWINISAAITGGLEKTIAKHMTDDSNYWLLQITATQMRFAIKESGSFTLNKTETAVTWSVGTWYHIKIIRDSSNNIQFYVDGVAKGGTTSHTSAIPNFTDTLKIGDHNGLSLIHI